LLKACKVRGASQVHRNITVAPLQQKRVAEKAVAALVQLLLHSLAPLLHLPALLPLDQRELLELRGGRVQSFDVEELVDVEEFDFESEVRVWRNQAAGSSIAVRVVWIHRGLVSSVARGLVSLKEWVWGVDS